ncbi:MAG: hypothetical protein OEY01_15990 [Desulfobulbaceae bacterium]|nr:hypothetical protein [Desulfobulbaceae bacterium]HIJ80003.1 hypothetical protein [Deltaproteobacteria bacterium]
MKKISILMTTILVALTFTSFAIGGTKQNEKAFTLPKLVDQIADYEKKEIMLTGTVLGACGSGCKIWVGEEDYENGSPVALVWAKDKAFKFKSDAVGQKVMLKGYAVAKYVNLCPTENKEQAGQAKKCDPLKKDGAKQGESGQLKSITFFATSIEYLK